MYLPIHYSVSCAWLCFVECVEFRITVYDDWVNCLAGLVGCTTTFVISMTNGNRKEYGKLIHTAIPCIPSLCHFFLSSQTIARLRQECHLEFDPCPKLCMVTFNPDRSKKTTTGSSVQCVSIGIWRDVEEELDGAFMGVPCFEEHENYDCPNVVLCGLGYFVMIPSLTQQRASHRIIILFAMMPQG